jgi:hypothetical protein
MEDEIVDLGKVRESKAKEFDGYSQHMDGIRQQILRLAIKDMRKFSGKEEIAKTLRFAVVSKAEAAEGRAFSEIARTLGPASDSLRPGNRPISRGETV